jgi:hypothetical protein
MTDVAVGGADFLPEQLFNALQELAFFYRSSSVKIPQSIDPPICGKFSASVILFCSYSDCFRS